MENLNINKSKKEICFDDDDYTNILMGRIFAYRDYYSYILECNRRYDKKRIILFQALRFKDEFI